MVIFNNFILKKCVPSGFLLDIFRTAFKVAARSLFVQNIVRSYWVILGNKIWQLIYIYIHNITTVIYTFQLLITEIYISLTNIYKFIFSMQVFLSILNSSKNYFEFS